eukprot:15359915-Ditylum_brightwellii.AAC.1
METWERIRCIYPWPSPTYSYSKQSSKLKPVISAKHVAARQNQHPQGFKPGFTNSERQYFARLNHSVLCH